MFVYYFVTVELPFEAAESRVVCALSGLPDKARAAYRHGEQIRARLGVGGRRFHVAKTVRLEVGDAVRGTCETAVPLHWAATGTPSLFPSMDADLVVAALGPSWTQLSLRGMYEPPLGGVGRALDRTLLHRVAEASVKRFVDDVAFAVIGAQPCREGA